MVPAGGGFVSMLPVFTASSDVFPALSRYRRSLDVPYCSVHKQSSLGTWLFGTALGISHRSLIHNSSSLSARTTGIWSTANFFLHLFIFSMITFTDLRFLLVFYWPSFLVEWVVAGRQVSSWHLCRRWKRLLLLFYSKSVTFIHCYFVDLFFLFVPPRWGLAHELSLWEWNGSTFIVSWVFLLGWVVLGAHLLVVVPHLLIHCFHFTCLPVTHNFFEFRFISWRAACSPEAPLLLSLIILPIRWDS